MNYPKTQYVRSPKLDAGMRFSKLLVLSRTTPSKTGLPKWLCRCDCGQEVAVIQYNLTKGNTTNCGCQRREKCAARMKTLNFKHGATGSAMFKIWSGIIDRTTNPNHEAYPLYGGRGIMLHGPWHDFSRFSSAVGDRPSKLHSIDRIDNDKGYEPGNVRWATMAEQARNRRTNRRVVIGSVKMILTDAAKALGISKTTASRWLKEGRLMEAAA